MIPIAILIKSEELVTYFVLTFILITVVALVTSSLGDWGWINSPIIKFYV
jgi:hypothetical protein